MQKKSYTFKLTTEQQEALAAHLAGGNYRPCTVPHTIIAVEAKDCKVNLYKSGKCLVQGKGAEDWVTFVLEPEILQDIRIGYDEVLSPEHSQPHMGIDESGKGDFFGPLVIAAVYVTPQIVEQFREMDVRDSKTIKSDKKIHALAGAIRAAVDGQFTVVSIGPEAYNRLYTSIGNVNRMLAWGHARAIENLMEKVPSCPRAVADQFGPKHQIERALMKNGRSIKLEQRHKAESDPAVAAASILARAGFISGMANLSKAYGETIPRGASALVKQVAGHIVRTHGPEALLKTAKCHFKTTDEVLSAEGLTRAALPR
ncbi:MAG: ribonuclease HIII [Spartobacteria bacterium]|nr:ribonuclease HIII [Spartobacteria bacterium]